MHTDMWMMMIVCVGWPSELNEMCCGYWRPASTNPLRQIKHGNICKQTSLLKKKEIFTNPNDVQKSR